MGEAKRRMRAYGGIERELVFQPDDSRMVVKDSMDVEPILEGIARDREIMPNNGVNKHVARLPATVVVDLINRGIFYDEDAFKKWLNGPEATPWRIWRGSV